MADAPLIRDAAPADHKAWLALWMDYLTFSHTDLRPEVTRNVWLGITEPNPRFRCRLAVVGGKLLGFAIHHPHVSTWSVNPDCYLEDLFVAEQARGLGLGRALLDDLVAIARTSGWERLYWMTDQTNSRARQLYNSYSAADGTIRYRFRV